MLVGFRYSEHAPTESIVHGGDESNDSTLIHSISGKSSATAVTHAPTITVLAANGNPDSSDVLLEGLARHWKWFYTNS